MTEFVDVKVCVVVDVDGRYAAYGMSGVPDDVAFGTAAEHVRAGESRFVLTKQLPVPGTVDRGPPELEADAEPAT